MNEDFTQALQWYASRLPIPWQTLLEWSRSPDERLRALAYEAAASHRTGDLTPDSLSAWRSIVIPYALYLMVTGIQDSMGTSKECILDVVQELGAACVRGAQELASDLRDVLALAYKCRPELGDAIMGHGLEHWLTRPEVAHLFEPWDQDPRLSILMRETRQMLGLPPV